MRNKTTNQLRKDVIALDLALKMLRAETEGLRRSSVTVKKAIGAPLALWEEHWFSELPKPEQDNINRTSSLIAASLKPKPTSVINTVTTTSTAPVNVKVAAIKPKKRTRKTISTTNRNQPWSKIDDKNLMRMVKAKETHQHMADVLGRSVSSIKQRITILKKGK